MKKSNGECKVNFDYIYKNSDIIKSDNTNEVLRYAGCANANDEKIISYAKEALFEVSENIRTKASWRYADIISLDSDMVDFGFIKIKSEALAKNLKNCKYAVFMVATIGNEADFLIKKYSVTKMSKAVFYNAAGSYLIENYCDYVNGLISKQINE